MIRIGVDSSSNVQSAFRPVFNDYNERTININSRIGRVFEAKSDERIAWIYPDLKLSFR